MNVAPMLDLLLVGVLLGYAIYGIRIGLTRSIFVIAGVAVGIFLAMLFAQNIAQLASVPQVRVLVAVSVAIALVAVGHAVGSAAGKAIQVSIETKILRGADRAVGGLAIFVVAALVISTVSFSAAQLGVPILSRTISASSVIRTIQDVTPDVVEANIARWRTALSDRALPLLGSPLGDPNAQIPTIDADSPALAAAAQSVVRITGNAYACGQGQTGSGFVIAPERIMTNAHVVSGTSGPVVEALNGQVLPSSIVYFDSVNDLAVLAVPGLTADALRLGDTARPGTSTAIQGYPYGGPFTTQRGSRAAREHLRECRHLRRGCSAPRGLHSGGSSESRKLRRPSADSRWRHRWHDFWQQHRTEQRGLRTDAGCCSPHRRECG